MTGDEVKILFRPNQHETDFEITEQLRKAANSFCEGYGICASFTRAVLFDVINMYGRDIDKMLRDQVRPNKYRQAAALAIWLIRLKPAKLIAIKPDSFFRKDRRVWIQIHINELFALFIALAMILGRGTILRNAFNEFCDGHILGDNAHDDIITVLRYRSISRHSLSIILQLVCGEKVRP